MLQITNLIPRMLNADAPTDSVVENAMDFAERVTFSLEKTLLGLFRVFLVLAILYAVVLLLKVVFYDIPNRKKQREEKSTAEKTDKPESITPAPISESAIPAPTAMSDEDARLTAAITAAIAVYLEEEASRNGTTPSGFRVVSYQRKGGAWNRRGI